MAKSLRKAMHDLTTDERVRAKVGEIARRIEVELVRGNWEGGAAAFISGFRAMTGLGEVQMKVAEIPLASMNLPTRTVNTLESYLDIVTLQDLIAASHKLHDVPYLSGTRTNELWRGVVNYLVRDE